MADGHHDPKMDKPKESKMPISSRIFSIMHLNIQCLRNKTLDFEVLMNNDFKFVDVICLTEHWLEEHEHEFLPIPNFKYANIFNRKKNKNGGSLILIKDTVLFKPKQYTMFLNDEFNFEHVVAELDLPDFKINLVCLYRSPSGSLEIFLNKFEQLLSLLQSDNQNLIVCGDFNVNFLSDNSAKDDILYLTAMFNLVPSITEPTRVTRTTQTCIDQIFVDLNDSFHVSTSNVNLGLSDHNAIFLHLHISCHPSVNRTRTVWRRSHNPVNVNYFNYLMSKESWIDVLNIDDLNSKTNLFIDMITYNYNMAFPLVKYTVSHGKNKKGTWITRGIITSCKRKRFLLEINKKCSDPTLNEYVKRYSNILKKVIIQAKKMYNSNLIANSNNKNKALWDLVKRETGKINNNIESLEINHNGRNVANPSELSNIFNNYFATVAGKISVSSPTTPGENSTELGTDRNVNSVFLYPTTKDELFKIINELKGTLATGIDGIPDFIIKKSIQHIVTPIIDICNTSLATGSFPEILKVAKIRPVHKKGDKTDIGNYRPISLLSVFSKILEKVMYNRLMPFLEKYNILSESQFGFRKGISINNAIFSFTEEVLNARNKKENVAGLFIDLTKAFDVVNHNILISKLEAIGIRGLANQWFTSYLNNRSHIVEINGKVSNLAFCNLGVPQGSILGPLLFLIYINDLPSYLPQAFTVLFADDTNLIFKNKSLTSLQLEINNTVSQLQDWLQKNRLHLNIKKTVSLNFGLYNTLGDSLNILIHGGKVNKCDNTKFLGIHVDSDLSWDCHISSLREKLCRLSYAMRVLAKVCTLNILRIIYFGCVQSIISFGIPFWGSASKTTQIFILQKKIVKIMKQVPLYTHTKPIFRELNILTVPCLYILESVSFIHLNKHMFKLNCDFHSYNTRISGNFHVTQNRLNLNKKAVSYIGILMYNRLPPLFHNMNIKLFKRKVKEILMNHQFYSVDEFLASPL